MQVQGYFWRGLFIFKCGRCICWFFSRFYFWMNLRSSKYLSSIGAIFHFFMLLFIDSLFIICFLLLDNCFLLLTIYCFVFSIRLQWLTTLLLFITFCHYFILHFLSFQLLITRLFALINTASRPCITHLSFLHSHHLLKLLLLFLECVFQSFDSNVLLSKLRFHYTILCPQILDLVQWNEPQ